MLQRGVLDFTALSLGIVCSLRPAHERLNARHPPQSLCKLQNFVLQCTTIAMCALMYWACVGFMTAQSWYTGGNGSDWKVSFALHVCHNSCASPGIVHTLHGYWFKIAHSVTDVIVALIAFGYSTCTDYLSIRPHATKHLSQYHRWSHLANSRFVGQGMYTRRVDF